MWHICMPKKMDRGTYVNNMQFLHICDILMIYIPLHACAKIKPKWNILMFWFFLLNNNRIQLKYKKTTSKSWKINSPWTNNIYIHVYTLVPLVWKWVEIRNPKQIPIFIKCPESLHSNFRRICHLELQLSQGSLQCLNDSYNSNDGIILPPHFLTMLQYYNNKKPQHYIMLYNVLFFLITTELVKMKEK